VWEASRAGGVRSCSALWCGGCPAVSNDHLTPTTSVHSRGESIAPHSLSSGGREGPRTPFPAQESGANRSPCSPVLAPRSAAEDLEEGFAEVGVEGRVDDGVEGTVHVAEPGAGTVEPWGHMAGWAVGIEDVNQEEGQPADYECPWV